MKKIILILPLILSLLAGCSDSSPKAAFTGVKESYNQKETGSFCMKNSSSGDIVCHVRLETAAADGAWREVTGDLQAVGAKDKKNVDRNIKPRSSLCETWMIENTVKESKLALPGKFRLAGYCYKAGEQVDASKAVRFYSESFEISK